MRNERAVLGKFAGLVTGRKSKDDLKDIAQALCLELEGKNQELADRINRHLDKSLSSSRSLMRLSLDSFPLFR